MGGVGEGSAADPKICEGNTTGAAQAPRAKSAKRSALTKAIIAAGPRAKDPWTVDRWRKRIRKRFVREPGPRLMPGEDRDVTPPPKRENVNPWGRWAGRAFDLMPTEAARLQNVQTRASACRRGKGIEIEHIDCGSRFVIRFGCRTRVCADCATHYQAAKRARFEPLMRLHQEAGEKSKLKFLTLTFPNVEWETPTECRDWMRGRTQLLRRFLFSKETPKAWGVKGYVAVWEVTAERECARCHLGRREHDGKTGKGRGPDPKSGRVRSNDCAGWIAGEKTGRYHPHLHILIWSNFIPLNEKVRAGLDRREYLQHAWADLTGGRQISLSPVEGPDAVGYILKYLGKPWAGVPDDLQVVALYRVRRLTSVGQFYGRAFRMLTAATLTDLEKQTWKLVCPRCGVRAPEHPPAIAECSGTYVHYETDEETGEKRACVEWATVKVGAELMDLSEGERLWLPAAWMAPIGWDGIVRGDDYEQVDVERKQTKKKKPKPKGDPPCPF